MRVSGMRSIGPNFSKSTFGHGSNCSPRPPVAPAATAGVPFASVCLTKPCTSSRVMRPLGPLPRTVPSVTPSSRAKRRIAGLA